MAKSFSCKCAERTKPIAERDWVVIQYFCNYSAFNGYRKTPSNYSLVECLSCKATGRTKADYVIHIKRKPHDC